MPHSFKASTPSTSGARCWLYGFSLLLAACTWQPSARPIQPELVFEGAARVDAMLGRGDRHALVLAGTVEPGSTEAAGLPPGDGTLKHFRVVDTQTLTFCALPPEFAPNGGALLAPNLHGDDVAKLWLPLRSGDAKSEAGVQLYFSDENCKLKGPFGKLGRQQVLTLRGDARQVLFSLRAGELTLIDPWSGEVRLVARDVEAFEPVEADTSASAQETEPQAVLLLEGPKLTMRALDGSLLLSLGDAFVREFQQQRFVDGLRIAFRDGEDLFEAKGPAFVPTLVAAGACHPIYRSSSLDLWYPCAAEQLVRLELLNISTRHFPPEVYEAFSLGDIDVERARTRDKEEQVYASTKGGPRVRVLPLPLGVPSPVGATQLAGLTLDGRFGVWSLGGAFVEVLTGVQELRAFRGARTLQLEWLVLHDRQGDFVRVSTFTQRDVERALADRSLPLALTPIAEGVPSQGGYRLAGGIGAEPVVLTLEQATLLPDKRYQGVLHARVLSGALDARIDEGVSSNQLVIAPQPAVLYGISEGARSGLWYAAL